MTYVSTGLLVFPIQYQLLKIDFIETFQVCFQHETSMICCNYNSVSDSSMKFTRFGVSSYTCNLDFAVEYSN